MQELPPLQNFSPVQYQAENQNWGISQAEDKTIYVANNKGLMNYNGASWSFYPSPNETIIRSVKVDGDRVYTGCYMEFGFWEKDEFGILQYTSLSKNIALGLAQDEEFWTILTIDEYVIFQSRKRIYIYNLEKNTSSFIDAESEISKIFALEQSVYYQELNEGIFKIEQGKELLVYDEEVVKTDEVVNIFDKEGELLILTRHRGFYRAKKNYLEKWITPSEELLSEISIYSGIQLRDKSFALGTISQGLIILDENAEYSIGIDEIRGLQNNTVLSVFEDVDQNLWLGLDNGISYVNPKSRLKVFHDNRGIVGSVYTSAILNGYLYLGTNQGLFCKRIEGDSEFTFIKGTQGQVWSLDQIGETLFCGHHSGTFIVDRNKALKIADIPGTWKIGSIEGQRDLLLQGNYSGLYVLEKFQERWQLRNRIDGFDHSARFFEVLGEELFVNHEYKGIFKLELDRDFKAVKKVVNDTTMIGANSGIVKFKDALYYGFQKGIFKYDPKEGEYKKDSILSKLYDDGEYVSGKMTVDSKDEYLWVFTASNINFISGGRLANTPVIRQFPLAANSRNSVAGYESVTGLPEESNYLFGTSWGYITADISKTFDREFKVAISTVKQAGKNTNKADEIFMSPTREGQFKNKENNLEIAFHTPEYNSYIKPKYQYQLLGIYDSWSIWSEESSVLFENLPHGEYSFRVRAKVGDKVSGNTAVYSFEIARPWYSSNMMLLVYFFLIVLFSLIVHNIYRLYYRKRQDKLIEENKRQLEFIRLQNEQEMIKLRNKQLEENFRNKSNELAASTMSILKKNQLLSKVKEQLLASETDVNTVKPLINLIDKNLKRNDDWELFKEAFNNADREFLKKLESVHPNLTPNDIRLCAYLRLNLSSKEVAELLNISPRSVEIKRYRLRKKMNLSHEDNLVNYILKL